MDRGSVRPRRPADPLLLSRRCCWTALAVTGVAVVVAAAGLWGRSPGPVVVVAILVVALLDALVVGVRFAELRRPPRRDADRQAGERTHADAFPVGGEAVSRDTRDEGAVRDAGWSTWRWPTRGEVVEQARRHRDLAGRLERGRPVAPEERAEAGRHARWQVAHHTTLTTGALPLVVCAAAQLARPSDSAVVWLDLLLLGGGLVMVAAGFLRAARWRRVVTDRKLVDPPSSS